MTDTALDEVRHAEKEADNLIGNAASKRNAIISEARVKAAQFLKDKEEDLAKMKAEATESLKGRLLAAREKMLGEGTDKIKALRKSAEKKTGEAAELVLEAFENEISKL